jgi:hypothetical protein
MHALTDLLKGADFAGSDSISISAKKKPPHQQRRWCGGSWTGLSRQTGRLRGCARSSELSIQSPIAVCNEVVEDFFAWMRHPTPTGPAPSDAGMIPAVILEGVVSGGQSGSDQVALWAARRYGIATGGWAARREIRGSKWSGSY